MSGGETTAQSREGFVNGISLPYRLAIGWFHYRQGRKAEERKDWKAARRAFRRAARQRPQAPIYSYRLARNYERLEDHPKAAECYQDAIALDSARAHWHARLATVLALQKHYQAAEQSYRRALSLNDRPAEWHAELADILERRGLDLAAIAAWRAAIERKGRVPTYHFRLGCCLERAADRSGFMCALDPQSLADLGRAGPDWIAELAQAERISGAAFWQEAKVAYHRALEGKGNKTEVWFRLGRLLEKQEDWKGAADAYAHALHKTLDKVRWLYRYQYCASLAGLSSDSTFKVTFTPSERAEPATLSNSRLAAPEEAATSEVSLTSAAAGAVIGYWHAIPAPARFEIRGNLFSDVATVYLFVDDRMVKAINVEDASADGHIHKTFYFSMKKRLLQSFPWPARIAIAADTGRLVHFSGANDLLIEVTGAENTLFNKLDAGSYISKKGTLVARKRSPAGLQKRLLAAYETLQHEFDKRFDRPLFLLFGTLLGKVRDGGLLPGDDDFDVGYVSAGSTPEEVKAEALGFIETLVKAGYTLCTNPSGRLFKAQVNGLWIDIFPVWESDGRIWIHNSTSYDGTLEDFLPLQAERLAETQVWLPRNPEAFLEGNYGAGWRVPDPGFRYMAARSVKRYLRRAHIKEKELERLQEELERYRQSHPETGEFIGPKKWRLMGKYREERASLQQTPSLANAGPAGPNSPPP